MKKSFLLVFITYLSLVFACNSSISIEERLEKLDREQEAFLKKVENIKDDSLRNDLKKFGGMLFLMKRIGIQNEKAPTDTGYEENPFQILDQYPSGAVLADKYLSGIVVENNADYSTKRVLNIHYPFVLPFQQNDQWKEVAFANTNALKISDKFDETLDAPQAIKTNWNGKAAIEVTYSLSGNAEIKEPISLKGNITAVIPKEVIQFKFSADEVGDTKEINGVKVKLMDIKGHAVSVEVLNPNSTDPSVDQDQVEMIKVVARDQTGGFLDQSGSSTGSNEMFERYEKILDRVIANPENLRKLQKEMEEDDKAFHEKHKNTTYYRTYYRGSVNDVIVYVLDYSKATKLTRELDLKAYSFKNDVEGRAIEQIPLTTTVYDGEIAKQLSRKSEIGAAELQKSLKVDQKAYEIGEGKMKYESNGEISFRYPEVLSNIFLSDFERYGKLKEIKFTTTKDGDRIDYPKDSVDFDDEYVERKGKPWAEYTVNRIEFNPTKFSTTPKYVSGTVEVNQYEVRKITFKADFLPQGVDLTGNTLVVDQAVADDQSIFHVKDKSGKYLKLLTTVSYRTPTANGYTRRKVYYYYGIPTTIERFDKGEMRTVDFKFAVELLPMVKEKG